MNKIIWLLFLFVVLITTSAHSASFRPYTSLTGGGSGALDSETNMVEGDGAFVVTSVGEFYAYVCINSGETEASPTIIDPDAVTDPAGLRWHLVSSNYAGFYCYGAATIGDGGDLIVFHLDSTPGTDDTWSGKQMAGTGGEAISQWDLVYCKNSSGTAKWYKYDANGTDKLYPPRGIAVTSCAGDSSSFVIGIGDGIARNDGWSQTTNQDEGKDVFASAATAGAIALTAPSTVGDEIARVGYILEENVILFSLGNVTLLEVQ